MCDFWVSSELLANIIGGALAAGLVGLAAWIWRSYKRWVINSKKGGLIVLMGEAIQHRNAGEKLHKDGGATTTQQDRDDWIRKADEIEKRAVKKAYQLSKSAGALVKWLDRIDPHPENDKFAKWWAILNKVIVRIRLILKENI